MNLYADIAEATIDDVGRIEAARKVLAARWPKVNPGVEHVESITETTRTLGNGREERVLILRWGSRDED